jgi:hypothetical protein
VGKAADDFRQCAGDRHDLEAVERYLQREASLLPRLIRQAEDSLNRWKENAPALRAEIIARNTPQKLPGLVAEKGRLKGTLQFLFNSRSESAKRADAVLHRVSFERPSLSFVTLDGASLRRCSPEQLRGSAGYSLLHGICAMPDVDKKISIEPNARGNVTIVIDADAPYAASPDAALMKSGAPKDPPRFRPG